MGKTPCVYSVVRFNHEGCVSGLINMGVVLYVPQQSLLLFKLSTTIALFLPKVSQDIFWYARDAVLLRELYRVRQVLAEYKKSHLETEYVFSAQEIFSDLARRQESTICFSNPEILLSSNVECSLEELFVSNVGWYKKKRQPNSSLGENRV